MSLLMEALRKAEEAKNKASKDDKDKSATQALETAPGDAAVAQNTARASAIDLSRDPALSEQGPAIINPDPDEVETLASHFADSGLEPPTSRQAPSEDLEAIEFTTADQEDKPVSNTLSLIQDSEDEDGLSLMQSSYFSRTQKPGGFRLDDIDDDFLDAIEPESDDTSFMPAAESLSQPTDEPEVIVDEILPSPEPASVPPHPKRQSEAALAASRKNEEKAKRDSAGALFLAKENSQKRRLRKLVSIAAIAMVLPVAGIVYWLYTSLSASSGMEFNVQAGNLANRSFSDSVAQTQPPPTETAASATATLPANSTTPDTAVEQPVTDSTAASLIAAADNADAGSPAAQATDNTQPPPAPPVQPQTPALAANNQQAPGTQASAPTPAPTPPLAFENNNQANTARNTSEQNGLSFARTTTAPVINPDLNAAYDSYQQGDFDVAARLYRQVLMSEPNNHDAMMHLASVNLKLGNPAMAQNLYARLLELNPRDPLARAGLLETIQGDPLRQEAELKSLITAFPATAQLSFALGNLYATQNRWNEAQSAYFDALLAAKTNNAGPVSPDYAFNLAVSLERINQLRTALDYYKEAESLSRNASPGFDPALLSQRLNYLEQRLR